MGALLRKAKPLRAILFVTLQDYAAHDPCELGIPSIDTLKKRRETLLKVLKQALDFYLKIELGEEKAISEYHHPQDSRMKILMLLEKVALALKNNKIGERA
jgi:hypothetical protein